MKRWTTHGIIALATIVFVGLGYLEVAYIASAPPSPTLADVPYEPSEAQRFDVWKPAGASPFPMVLAVHGGAFLFGDKRSHDGLKEDINLLVANGIAVVSTNYRLSGEAKFPAAAQDVAAALAELRRQGPSLGLDPNRVALWGKSAGANLALLVGLAGGRSPIGNGTKLPVVVIVAMYPPVGFDVMDDQLRNSACGVGSADHGKADSPESQWLGGELKSRPDLVAAASPLTCIGPSSPPVLVQAGSADCMVPHQHSEMLAAALGKAGVSVRLDILPDATHIDPKFNQTDNLKTVLASLKRVFSAPTKVER